MDIHRSDLYRMRGAGIGSIFTNIFRGLIPIAKGLFSVGRRAAASSTGQKVLQAAKRSAVQAGLDVAHDALSGQNVAQSLKKRGRQAGLKMVDELQKGGGRKKKGGAKTKKRKAAVKKKAGRGKRGGGGRGAAGLVAANRALAALRRGKKGKKKKSAAGRGKRSRSYLSAWGL